jgi:hypothetical protein
LERTIYFAFQELLSHPLSSALIDYKWRKFGRFVTYGDMAVYCVFLAMLTGFALSAYPPQPTIDGSG